MRSFACVAVMAAGGQVGRFEAVLGPLPGRRCHMRGQPQRLPDPRPVVEVLADWVRWLQRLPEPRAFPAAPVSFDGARIDYYLRRFTRFRLMQGAYEPQVLFHAPCLCLASYAEAVTQVLFHAPCLCLASYAEAVTGRPIAEMSRSGLPAVWLGGVEHTHRAIDDALGYAHLLVELFRRLGASAS
jgi:hypothetical protein